MMKLISLQEKSGSSRTVGWLATMGSGTFRARLAGATDFNRLRIGVGHPGDRSGVTGHVLGKVSKADRELIENCIEDAIATIPVAVRGDWQLAMQQLHNV